LNEQLKESPQHSIFAARTGSRSRLVEAIFKGSDEVLGWLILIDLEE
jgi:hypothetical protein